MSKFCGRCGSLLDANGKCSVCIDNHVVKEKNKVVKNKRKLLLFVMITALALAICGFVCFKIIDFSPEHIQYYGKKEIFNKSHIIINLPLII